jgi:hypothetical protein
MYQSFYVPLDGGAETEVFRMNAGTVGLPTQAWNGNKFQLGNYIMWVDGTGRLRIKNGAPTSISMGQWWAANHNYQSDIFSSARLNT